MQSVIIHNSQNSKTRKQPILITGKLYEQMLSKRSHDDGMQPSYFTISNGLNHQWLKLKQELICHRCLCISNSSKKQTDNTRNSTDVKHGEILYCCGECRVSGSLVSNHLYCLIKKNLGSVCIPEFSFLCTCQTETKRIFSQNPAHEYL